MKVQIDSKEFRTKPKGQEIGGIKHRLINHETIKDLTTQQIVDAIVKGQTIQPGVCPFSKESKARGSKGTVKEDFLEQTLL